MPRRASNRIYLYLFLLLVVIPALVRTSSFLFRVPCLREGREERRKDGQQRQARAVFVSASCHPSENYKITTCIYTCTPTNSARGGTAVPNSQLNARHKRQTARVMTVELLPVQGTSKKKTHTQSQTTQKPAREARALRESVVRNS